MADNEAFSALTYLVSCALNGTAPERERVEAMALRAVYAEAERQMLTALAHSALESAGVRDAAFAEAYAKAVRKAALLSSEFAALTGELESAGIWYLPLKGIVLQADYPRFGLRQMSDVDVLIDPTRAADVRDILVRRGYSVESFERDFHDVYHKPPVVSFEIHTALFSPVYTPVIRDYYAQIAGRLLPEEGTCFGRRLSDEDLYVYLLAHEHKHYSMGGTGLRSLADTWVFLRRHGADLRWDYIFAELAKLGLTDFEAENRALSADLFGGEALSATERRMLGYLAASGAYGRREQKIENAVADKGPLRYALSRVFLPSFYVKKAYPWFYAHRAALPLLPFYRLWLGLTERRGAMASEVRAIFHKKK